MTGTGLDDDRRHSDGPRGQHGDRALLDRHGREVVAVGAGTRQGKEQPTGTDGPRVELDRPADPGGGGLLGADVGETPTDDGRDLGDRQVDHVR